MKSLPDTEMNISSKEPGQIRPQQSKQSRRKPADANLETRLKTRTWKKNLRDGTVFNIISVRFSVLKTAGKEH